MSRIIVTLSGGAGSAWCAFWAREHYGRQIQLYFNDTRWEDEDLYRFLDDVERVIDLPIFRDSDGRSPEEVFYDEGMLGNNRVPLCSRILKAERLQKYAKPGDIAIFGIEPHEPHRAARLEAVYGPLGVTCVFPMLQTGTTKLQALQYLNSIGIATPRMYREGFAHNNCGGGCIRGKKAHWRLCLRERPEVFAAREQMEKDFSLFVGKRATILPDMSLAELRELVESQPEMDFGQPEEIECVGICSLEN